MDVFYRKADGTDPLGDVEFTGKYPSMKTTEEALGKGWEMARRFNQGQRKGGKHYVVTVQCGALLLDVATGKLRSLTGPTPAPLVAQPALPLADRRQPSLFGQETSRD